MNVDGVRRLVAPLGAPLNSGPRRGRFRESKLVAQSAEVIVPWAVQTEIDATFVYGSGGWADPVTGSTTSGVDGVFRDRDGEVIPGGIEARIVYDYVVHSTPNTVAGIGYFVFLPAVLPAGAEVEGQYIIPRNDGYFYGSYREGVSVPIEFVTSRPIDLFGPPPSGDAAIPFLFPWPMVSGPVSIGEVAVSYVYAVIVWD